MRSAFVLLMLAGCDLVFDLREHAARARQHIAVEYTAVNNPGVVTIGPAEVAP